MHFTHFGELYRYLETQPSKDDFLHYRVKDVYKAISKEEFLLTVRYLALAFHKRGWKGKQIAIAVSPSPYWLMLDYALMLCGAVSVPLFSNISSKNLQHQILDASVHTVFIEKQSEEKIIYNASNTVEIVYLEEHSGYHSFDEFVLEGKKIEEKEPSVFGSLIYQINPENVVSIVYTSGTSGLPKGVELTHTNLISQIHGTHKNYHFDKEKDIAFSFLPLAHIFERMVMHFYLSGELSIYFSDDVKNVAVLLKEVNPTVMTVVPRLLEKVFFKMKLKALEGNFIKQILVRFAFYRATTKDPMTKLSWIDKVLDTLVYKKLRLALGTRMVMMISGGAALSELLYKFYLNIGIPLYQGYGLTELSPVICSNTPQYNKIGSCGKSFPGVEVKISAEGELLARGQNIMKGYHANKSATAEAIDRDGWLHTGDLASIDDEGYISITGRKGEQFKTSTGEFVSSVYIEQALVSNGWFEYALIVGNNKPYVLALLFVEHEFLGRFAEKMHTTPLKAIESDKFLHMTEAYIKKLNQTLNPWEQIRKFKVISDVLSIENGHLTPSMKVAKTQLIEQYSDAINEMYKDDI